MDSETSNTKLQRRDIKINLWKTARKNRSEGDNRQKTLTPISHSKNKFYNVKKFRILNVNQ